MISIAKIKDMYEAGLISQFKALDMMRKLDALRLLRETRMLLATINIPGIARAINAVNAQILRLYDELTR